MFTSDKFEVERGSTMANRYGNHVRFQELAVELRDGEIRIEATFKTGSALFSLSLDPRDAARLSGLLDIAWAQSQARTSPDAADKALSPAYLPPPAICRPADLAGTLVLSARGHGRRDVKIANVAEASIRWQQFREFEGIGMSDLDRQSGIIVGDSGELLAKVSYNGRVWHPDGKTADGRGGLGWIGTEVLRLKRQSLRCDSACTGHSGW